MSQKVVNGYYLHRDYNNVKYNAEDRAVVKGYYPHRDYNSTDY